MQTIFKKSGHEGVKRAVGGCGNQERLEGPCSHSRERARAGLLEGALDW